MPHGTPISDEMRRCIEECLSCFRTCLETVLYAALYNYFALRAAREDERRLTSVRVV